MNALKTAAAQQVLPLFRARGMGVENKADSGFDPVTQADREAERVMREILSERRPDDGILGEEFGERPGRSGLVWILDPIDGTRAFIAGAPSWGTLIALGRGLTPVMGMISQPFTGETWVGGLGVAEHHGPMGQRPLAVSSTEDLGQAILMTTMPELGTAAENASFARVSEQVRLTRYGLDCYAYGLLALGFVDLVIEAGLKPYDIAAPRAVIEAAGGLVTNWQGGSADAGGQVIAAATPALHRAALALLGD